MSAFGWRNLQYVNPNLLRGYEFRQRRFCKWRSMFTYFCKFSRVFWTDMHSAKTHIHSPKTLMVPNLQRAAMHLAVMGPMIVGIRRVLVYQFMEVASEWWTAENMGYCTMLNYTLFKRTAKCQIWARSLSLILDNYNRWRKQYYLLTKWRNDGRPSCPNWLRWNRMILLSVFHRYL